MKDTSMDMSEQSEIDVAAIVRMNSSLILPQKEGEAWEDQEIVHFFFSTFLLNVLMNAFETNGAAQPYIEQFKRDLHQKSEAALDVLEADSKLAEAFHEFAAIAPGVEDPESSAELQESWKRYQHATNSLNVTFANWLQPLLTAGNAQEMVQNTKAAVSSKNLRAFLPILPRNIAVWTGQETDVMIRSAADGARGIKWRNDILSGRRVWESEGATHHVEIARLSSIDEEPLPWEQLEQLTGDQNADFALVLFYVGSCLSPVPDSPGTRLLTGVIDLNDVMAKIGWLAEKPNQMKRDELRQKLWRFFIYGEEAVLVGQRSVTYRDPTTQKEIPTRMESAAWKIINKGRPEGDPQAAPHWVEIVIGRQWEAIFSDPRLAQYMPLGEILGAIPPHKVGGDWARNIGLTLAYIWRCKPRETINGELRITRHDLLTHFTPKTKTVREILSSNNPRRAASYYREALNILLEAGLIAPKGDAAKDMTPDEMLKPYGREGWSDKWLYDDSNLVPGPLWMPVIVERAKALPPARPRDLRPKKHRKSRRKVGES